MHNKMIIRGGYNPSRDPAISIIRVLAFLFIITCHIMQYYDCELAWWFNVGVQMFLCLSGYLYGRKTIDNELSFYKKQLIKILVPYYIVVVGVSIAQILFARNEISLAHIAKALLCYGTLRGGEHLWFVPTILFCYFLTPLFDKLNNCFFEKKCLLLYCIISFALLSIVVKLFVPYFNPAWIACFYIGHVLGKNEIKRKISPRLCKGMIYVGALCLVSIQIVITYILRPELSATIQMLLAIMYDYGHTFLGITIVLILLDVFRTRIIPNVIMKPIMCLDYISYEGYLIHQFFILGTFSLLTIIDLQIVAVFTIFLITLICGITVKIITQQLKKLIK